jgi:hypothetical protein
LLALKQVELDGPFYNNTTWRLIAPDNSVIQQYTPDGIGRGMQHQGIHFEDCLAKGLTESPILSLSQSVEIMEAMDSVLNAIH